MFSFMENVVIILVLFLCEIQSCRNKSKHFTTVHRITLTTYEFYLIPISLDFEYREVKKNVFAFLVEDN